LKRRISCRTRTFCNATGASLALFGASSGAQPVADIGFDSVGRAAPLPVAIPFEPPAGPDDFEAYPPAEIEGYPER